MANSIPQSLQYLTGYLKEENARLEQEYEEKKMEQSISDVANKFKSLGENATLSDARSLYFEAIQHAAQTGSTESLPMIQGMYQNQLHALEQMKVEKRDEAVSGAFGKLYPGLDTKGMGAAGTASFLGTTSQLTKPQPFEDIEGRDYLGNLRWNPESNQWDLRKEGAMMLKPTTRAQEIEEKKDFERFKYGLELGLVRARHTADQMSLKQSGYTDENNIPLVYTNGRYYKVDDATGKFVEHTGPVKRYESEYAAIGTQLRQDKLENINRSGAASALIAALRSGDQKTRELTKDLYSNNKLIGNADEVLLNKLLTTSTKSKENILWEAIRKMPEGVQKDQAISAYKNFKQVANEQKLNEVETANYELAKDAFETNNMLGVDLKYGVARILQQQGESGFSKDEDINTLAAKVTWETFNKMQNIDKKRILRHIVLDPNATEE